MTQEEKENLLLVSGLPIEKASEILAKLGSKDREIAELKTMNERLIAELARIDAANFPEFTEIKTGQILTCDGFKFVFGFNKNTNQPECFKVD